MAPHPRQLTQPMMLQLFGLVDSMDPAPAHSFRNRGSSTVAKGTETIPLGKEQQEQLMMSM